MFNVIIIYILRIIIIIIINYVVLPEVTLIFATSPGIPRRRIGRLLL